LAAIGFETGLLVLKQENIWAGFSAGATLIGASLSLLITSCCTVYHLFSLLITLTLTMCFSVLGLVYASIHFSKDQCFKYNYNNCDRVPYVLKILSIVLYLIALGQTIINIIVAILVRQKQRIVMPQLPNTTLKV
ncbi:unnamed protein product, partial [Didymodactylos carnosus]